MKKWIAAMLAVFVAAGWFPTTMIHAQKPKKYYIATTPLPKVVRVAIRENNWSGQPDPRGRVVEVKYYDFDRYIKDVLPNEWSASWKPESLKAGAIAIKMFAWYHSLHPVTVQGQTFDVDNTVNFQVFRDLTDQPETNTAIESVHDYAYVKRDGEIIELNYRAGFQGSANWQYRNKQKMSQWGSQYLADKSGYSFEKILQFYYYNRDLARIQKS